MFRGMVSILLNVRITWDTLKKSTHRHLGPTLNLLYQSQQLDIGIVIFNKQSRWIITHTKCQETLGNIQILRLNWEFKPGVLGMSKIKIQI